MQLQSGRREVVTYISAQPHETKRNENQISIVWLAAVAVGVPSLQILQRVFAFERKFWIASGIVFAFAYGIPFAYGIYCICIRTARVVGDPALP